MIIERCAPAQGERGTATIELALVLPVLTLLLLATVNYAIFLQRQLVITSAAEAGAAYATLPGKSSDTQGIRAAVFAAMPTFQDPAETSNRFWSCPPSDIHVDPFSTCSDGGTPRQWVAVSVSLTSPAIFAIPGLDSSLLLHAAITQPVPWSP